MGDKRLSVLKRGEVENIEHRLDELRYICEKNLEGDKLTDAKNKISAIEFTIQSNRQ